MQAIVDNLIHFLGRQHQDSPSKQLEIFKSILYRGLRCGEIQIKFGDGGVVRNQVVCFTDIPLSLCDEQAAIYGKFGIGFKKSFVKKSGGNPARYFINYLPGQISAKNIFENRGLLYVCLCYQFKILKQVSDRFNNDPLFAICDQEGKEIFKHDDLKQWIGQQLSIFSFEKETGELGPARDETRQIDVYYKEREWRLVPFQAAIDSGAVKLDNSVAYYEFTRNDINMVVTPNDDMRTEVLRYMLGLEKETDERLKEFSVNPVPVVTYNDLQKW
jgi:hypothetical protein